MTKALVILSGGQDSTTCLYQAIKNHGVENVSAITFDYNQNHNREIDCAIEIAERAGIVEHEVLFLPHDILQGISPLLSGSAEQLEQYADYESLPGGVEKTFIPMRNQLFITLAFNRAAVAGCYIIYTGVCEEDFGGYPDCRQDFIDHLSRACNKGLEQKEYVSIATPLMYLTKKKTVELAMALPGCYAALAYTHTGYDNAYPPVGKDHATLLREKGFAQAGVPDPLVLRAVSEGLMALPFAENYNAAALYKVDNLIPELTRAILEGGQHE